MNSLTPSTRLLASHSKVLIETPLVPLCGFQRKYGERHLLLDISRLGVVEQPRLAFYPYVCALSPGRLCDSWKYKHTHSEPFESAKRRGAGGQAGGDASN